MRSDFTVYHVKGSEVALWVRYQGQTRVWLLTRTNEQVSGLPLWMEMTQLSPQLENYVIQLLVRWQWSEEEGK